ncbi:MAG: major facilitator superfamily 1 [Acidobacteria bacterium]|jgi:MFS family permease|nr:major facilitator superfamily 1 [Acidobacteriota bacterium]
MADTIQPEISKQEVEHVGQEKKPQLRYAWYVLVVLTVMYMFSFVDRQILSLLVPWIKRDLRVNDTLIGLLAGFAFALFYTLVGLPIGRLADSRSRRNIVGISVFLWSIFTAACAGAKSFSTLFLARIGVGIGEAGLGPAAYSLIADYFPKERVGRAISFYYFGLFLGQSLALLVGGIAVDSLANTAGTTLPILGKIAGWQITFLIVGLPGILVALLALTIREPRRKNMLLTAEGKPVKTSFKEAMRQIRLRWQSFVGISAGMIFQCTCNAAVGIWVPNYFLRVHHWTGAQTGKALAFIMILFACSGMYFGGFLSDRWQQRGVLDGPIRVALLSGAGILLFMTPATLVPNPYVSLALLAVGMFLLTFPMGTSVAALQLIFPNQIRGQVAALFLFVLNLTGGSMGPLLPGVLNDHVFHNENMVGVSLAITLGVASVLMLVAFSLTMRPYRFHYRMMEEVVGK